MKLLPFFSSTVMQYIKKVMRTKPSYIEKQAYLCSFVRWPVSAITFNPPRVLHNEELKEQVSKMQKQIEQLI